MTSHTFFIAFSYALTALVIAGLALRAVIDHRIQTRALAELEARGVSRRSRRG
jgi:heme exporter protein D